MKAVRNILWILSIGLLIAGCNTKPSPSPSPQAQAKTELAQVQQLQAVSQETSPQQFRILVRGSLPDGCTSLGEPTSKRLENTIAYTLPIQQNNSDNCSAFPQDFETEIFLDTAALAAGVYTITVNGVTQIVKVPDQTAAQNPTPTPAAVPSPTPSPIPPTATQAAPPDPKPTAEETHAETGSPTPSAQAAQSTPDTQTTQASQPAQGSDTIVTTGGENGCTEKAAFSADVTIPDNTVFRQGETFVKTWRLRNEGDCTWDGYSLVFDSGDLLAARPPAPIPLTRPGEFANISVNLEAPQGGGQYTGRWLLENPAGQRFGVGINGLDVVWVQILVNYITSPEENIDSLGGTGVASANSGGPVQVTGPCTATRDTGVEFQIFNMINAYRVQNGLDPLTLNDQLTAAAVGYSMDMACNKFVDPVNHLGSDGSTRQQRIAAQGYPGSFTRENIFYGTPNSVYGDPNAAMNFWVNSTLHRNALLNVNAAEIGIAYIINPDSDYGGYYTTDFGGT